MYKCKVCGCDHVSIDDMRNCLDQHVADEAYYNYTESIGHSLKWKKRENGKSLTASIGMCSHYELSYQEGVYVCGLFVGGLIGYNANVCKPFPACRLAGMLKKIEEHYVWNYQETLENDSRFYSKLQKNKAIDVPWGHY